MLFDITSWLSLYTYNNLAFAKGGRHGIMGAGAEFLTGIGVLGWKSQLGALDTSIITYEQI